MQTALNATTVHNQIVEIETGNRRVGPFLRLPMAVLRERTGGVALSSHPFALAAMLGGQVLGVLVPSGDRAVRWATIGSHPGTARPPIACLSAENVSECRAYGERITAELGCELRVWDHTSLQLILGESA